MTDVQPRQVGHPLAMGVAIAVFGVAAGAAASTLLRNFAEAFDWPDC